jgi:hypothetical protein
MTTHFDIGVQRFLFRKWWSRLLYLLLLITFTVLSKIRSFKGCKPDLDMLKARGWNNVIIILFALVEAPD